MTQWPRVWPGEYIGRRHRCLFLNASRLKKYVSKLAVYRTRGLINGGSLRRNPYSLLSESLQKALEDPNAMYEDIQALGASHFPCKFATTYSRGHR